MTRDNRCVEDLSKMDNTASLNLQDGQLDHSSAKDTADANQHQLVPFKGLLSQACTDLLNTELHALKISKQLPENCPYLHLVCPEV